MKRLAKLKIKTSEKSTEIEIRIELDPDTYQKIETIRKKLGLSWKELVIEGARCLESRSRGFAPIPG